MTKSCRSFRWLALAPLVIPVGMLSVGRAQPQSADPPDRPREHVGCSLRASSNRHYLLQSNGAPLFLAGDTAWRIVAELTRSEMATYLDTRKEQGFNTVLFVAFPWQF